MAPQVVGLKTHIWNNNLRSIALIASYPILIMALVWAVSALLGAVASGTPQNGALMGTQTVMMYWPLILAVVCVWFMVSYFFHGRMVRMLSHAHPVTRTEEPELYNLVENLCISRGLRVPRLEIIETDALNAYASGIDERSYAITVTRGLMNMLDRAELEAVLAHELTHIINRDVRLLIISIIFTGMIGFAAQLVWSSVRYGLFSGNGRKDGRLILLVLAVAAILWIGYFATILTRFALSRRREYMADAGAVELTRDPAAMMRALLKISGRDKIPAAPDDIALMCIENSSRLMGLMATHPPIEARVQAISATTGTPVPDLNGESFNNPWA